MGKKQEQKKPLIQPIARNKKARFAYEILEKFEAGIELQGTEVKSLRNGDANLNESFARPRGHEILLLGMNIAPYEQGNRQNHEPTRPRKLLLHRREIKEIIAQVEQRGVTVVPLSLYFKHGLAKVEIALCRGKREFDKRQDLKRRDAEREIRRATRRGQRR